MPGKIALSIMLFFSISLSASAQGVKKQELLTYIQSSLPEILCAKDQIFGKCFKVSKSQCLSSTSNILSNCISKYESQIPAVIYDQKEAGNWGNTIGQCTGTDFSTKYIDKLIPNCI